MKRAAIKRRWILVPRRIIAAARRETIAIVWMTVGSTFFVAGEMLCRLLQSNRRRLRGFW